MPETTTTTTTATGITTETVSNRERIAKTVTYFVLSLTALVAIGSVIIIQSEDPKDRFGHYKDVLAILLPLWGTWIGTVLAYYFSKDNFESANKSVQNLVNSITSDKKLESTKAKDVMIPLGQLTYKDYQSEADADKYELKKDFLDWVTEKKISRVILLDNNKCAKYVLHKSIIEGFIAEQYFKSVDNPPPPPPPNDVDADDGQREHPEDAALGQGNDAANNQPANPPQNNPERNPPTPPKNLTFGDLRIKGNANVQAILKDGIKFIKEDANLAEAKTLIKNYAVCNDVFITKTGLETDPVMGWITDKTISESSIV
jgi:hypothetical protein